MPPKSDTVLSKEQCELINNHYGLAIKVATDFVSKHDVLGDVDDIYSDALLGLTQASIVFDPDKGFKFSTFAMRRIQGAILDGLRARTHSRSDRQKYNTVLFVPLPEVDNTIDFRFLTPDEAIDIEMDQLWLYQAIQQLSERTRKILLWYYLEDMPIVNISQILGCSNSRVWQIIHHGIEKMRQIIPEAN